jgi:SAM-dependent methyltransferase
MTTQTLDQAKAEAFGEKIVGIMTGGGLSLMISVGHRTRLFDKLSELPPSTSEEIATACGLNERYVREWLGGMVTGEIIEYDPATRQYRLPPEHAALLTRAAGPDNFAFMMQYIAVLGNVEDGIVECFEKGGGIPYSGFPTFQEIQKEETSRVFDAVLIDGVVPIVAGLPEQLAQGIEVADIGCGSGRAVNLLAKAFPNSSFTGYDFSAEGVATGAAEAKEWGLANAKFVEKDAAKLGITEQFDFITAFDSIHDQAQPRTVLANIAKALKPDGTFLLVDIAASSNLEENIGNPFAPMFFTWSTFHCMTVSLAQGGEGLGTCWGEQKAQELLAEAGFTNVETHKVDGDPINVYYICKK